MRWDVLAQAERHPEVAVVSADDDAARRAVQLDMPTLILDAGTGEYPHLHSPKPLPAELSA